MMLCLNLICLKFIKQFEMKYILKVITLFLLIAVACSKDNDDNVEKSNESKLLSFSVKEIATSFIISSNNSVESNVLESADLTNLTAVFSISEKAKAYVNNNLQTSGYTKNNYSNPVNFVVEAENGSKTTYTITINSEAKIKSFSIAELKNTQFTFDNLNINGVVPFGTDLSSLTAQFEITKNTQLFIDNTVQTK